MADPVALTLAASAARTASGEGTAQDAQRANLTGAFRLSCTAASGSGPSLAVTLEHSETGLDDAGWEEFGAFRELSGTSSASVTVGSLRRYLRAVWEIGGTTPSFTFAVTAKLYAHLVTPEQLYARVSPTTVRRVLDDSDSGEADEDALNAILADASSMLRGKIGPVSDLSTFTPETASELIRIGMDICQGRLALRRPEVMRMDGQKILAAARADLKDIRLGTAGLGTQTEAEAPDTTAYGYTFSDPPRPKF